MEVIKRYENRKLYSTKLSKYVTINYISELVKTSQKFRVVNVSDQSDITTKTIKKSLVTLPLSLESMTKLIKGL